MTINKSWHQANKMPKNPTLEQKIQWHLEHLKNCQCRTDLPPQIKEEIEKRKLN